MTDATHHDVVVVGARVAGAAAAAHLARQGLDVLVVDRAELGTDTTSTHAIARGGIVQLARLGVLDEVLAAGTPPIREADLHLPDGTVHQRTVKPRAGVDLFAAPRRTVLDPILQRAAEAAGARFETGLTVIDVRRGGQGRVTGIVARTGDGRPVHRSARLVVGADGVRSRIARAVDAATVMDQGPAGEASYAYVERVGTSFELHPGPRTLSGAIPTNDGLTCVYTCSHVGEGIAAGAPDRAAALLDLLDRAAPGLGPRVRARGLATPVRTAAGLPNVVRQPWGPGWALVGDAGYHRDPIAGHGITDALRDAELLARAAVDALGSTAGEARAMRLFVAERNAALADTFAATLRLGQLAGVEAIVEAQLALEKAMEIEATAFADRPLLAGSAAAA